MWEWLADNQAVAWLAAALILIGADMFAGLDMWLIMFGVGALAGAGAVALGVGTPIALIVAAVVSLLLLLLVRPPVLKRLHAGPELHSERVQDLVGRHNRAIENIDDTHGQIQLDGVVWTARPYLEDTRIPAGTTVEVFGVDELTVLVHPAGGPLTGPPSELDLLTGAGEPDADSVQSDPDQADFGRANSGRANSGRADSGPSDSGPSDARQAEPGHATGDARQADNQKEG